MLQISFSAHEMPNVSQRSFLNNRAFCHVTINKDEKIPFPMHKLSGKIVDFSIPILHNQESESIFLGPKHELE